jgi:hypothetical protein
MARRHKIDERSLGRSDRKSSRSIGGTVLSRRVPINFEFFHIFASKGEFDFPQVNLIGLLLASLFLLSSAQASNEGSNWPQWRGPDSQGISAEKGLPIEWDTEKNIVWKTPIAGRGHSSPIVWNNRIFLTTSLEGSVVPGAKAVKHMQGNEEFVHPDSMGADRSYTLKLPGSRLRRNPLGENGLQRNPVRQSPQEEYLCFTNTGYRWPLRFCFLRF